MSVDLYYPKLRQLEQRRDQLVNDASGLHRRILLRSESFEEADETISPTLVDVLQKKGISSAREVIDQTLPKLTDVKKTSLEKILSALQTAHLNFDAPISYFLALPLVSDGASGGDHLSLLVDSAALYVASRLSAKAVALSLSGSNVSLREASKTAQVASTIYETLQDQNLNPVIEFGLRVNRYAPDFSDIPLAPIVSVADGAAQVAKLQSDINYLFRKRLSLELADNLCSTSVTLTGKLGSVFTLLSKMRGIEAMDSSLQQAVDIIVTSFVNDVGSVWDSGTFEAAAAVWTATDRERSSYVEDDPSVEEAIEQLKR
ncbi:hypothetical protein FGB62_213g00 [Gracilaria domingensis]|nr:hypothetical protein FGB62_213g00 [Gracilaria domingensis]